MSKTAAAFLAGCALILFQCRESFVPFTLADRGTPCTIILPARAGSGVEADAAEQLRSRAAAELRRYLARLLGRPESSIALQSDAQAATGRILLLGKPAAKSRFAAAARRLEKAERAAGPGDKPPFRLDAWSDGEDHYLAITTRRDHDLLRAVYAFLDEQGARFLFPGTGGEFIPPRQEIRILHALNLPPAGLELSGFLPACPAGDAPGDSSTLLWWARQRFTHLPSEWGVPGSLNRLGIQGVRRSQALKVWKPGFCCSDEKARRELIAELFSGAEAELCVLDAAQATPLCSCSACQRLGSETDRWLHLVGQIGAAVGRLKKEVALPEAATLLALHDLSLPERSAPQDWPRAEILLAARLQPRCYAHALADLHCTEVNAGTLTALVKWLAATPNARHAVIEGYYAPEFAGLPLVLDQIIARDLETCRALGVQGFFCDAPGRIRPTGIRFYQDYLLGQALHQTHLQTDSLRKAFVAFAYPGAATMTLEYFAMLSEAFSNCSAWRGELPGRVRQLAENNFSGTLLPLERFNRHFSLYQEFSETDEGVAWERTFQLIHDARHLMDDLLEIKLPDQSLDRLLEAEKQLRFAELTVTLYDNIIRSLTLGEDEPAMREEAAIRLRQVVKRMEELTVAEGGCGTGEATALSASGLEASARALLLKLQQRYSLPYDRVYVE